MPRKKLIRDAEHPYHITSRANNKEWFYIPVDEVWEHSIRVLDKATDKFKVKVDAFVLMSNHYHLLIYTPEGNIDKFMQFFNQNLGRSIARSANRVNRIFGASYKWNLILSHQYFLNVLRYIYQNPVRANLAKNASNYPYCDIYRHKMQRELYEWLDTPISQSEQDKTRKKLRKYIVDILN